MNNLLNALDKKILKEVADLHSEPTGAYNIRKDGQGVMRRSVPGVEITPKTDQPGIEVMVDKNATGTVHIPVILTTTGLEETVYNTIDIGPGADILLVAGCGIHNPGEGAARHDGVHDVFVRKGGKLKYMEKHFGEGDGSGRRILNPKTNVVVEEGAFLEMELVQIRGVDDTVRETNISIEAGGQVFIFERLLTNGNQTAVSEVEIKLNGDDSAARIISRSVAQDKSRQEFKPRVIAYGRGKGHVECDSIIMGDAVIRSVPEIWAENAAAELVHEAAIGKIAGDQLIKLMALGLTKEEAEEAIISGFLS